MRVWSGLVGLALLITSSGLASVSRWRSCPETLCETRQGGGTHGCHLKIRRFQIGLHPKNTRCVKKGHNYQTKCDVENPFISVGFPAHSQHRYGKPHVFSRNMICIGSPRRYIWCWALKVKLRRGSWPWLFQCFLAAFSRGNKKSMNASIFCC